MLKNILKLHLPSAESVIKYFNVIQKNASIVANLKKTVPSISLITCQYKCGLCLKNAGENVIMNPL